MVLGIQIVQTTICHNWLNGLNECWPMFLRIVVETEVGGGSRRSERKRTRKLEHGLLAEIDMVAASGS